MPANMFASASIFMRKLLSAADHHWVLQLDRNTPSRRSQCYSTLCGATLCVHYKHIVGKNEIVHQNNELEGAYNEAKCNYTFCNCTKQSSLYGHETTLTYSLTPEDNIIVHDYIMPFFFYFPLFKCMQHGQSAREISIGLIQTN